MCYAHTGCAHAVPTQLAHPGYATVCMDSFSEHLVSMVLCYIGGQVLSSCGGQYWSVGIETHTHSTAIQATEIGKASI